MTLLELSPEEAVAIIKEEPKPFLLDVRAPWEHELSSISGDVLIPLDTLTSRLDEIPRDRTVVVYCHHGVRSLMAARYLQGQGFEALSLAGGIDRWSLEVDPTISRY